MRAVRRAWLWLLVFSCGPNVPPKAPYLPPPVEADHSLFWNDPLLLDDASFISCSLLMASASSDGHGGALLSQWFHRFATTAHSERALPAQFADNFASAHGSDPTTWDLSLIKMK